MIPRWIVLIFFFLIILACPLNSSGYEDSKERRINLWPLAVYKEEKELNQKSLELLGPFIYIYRTQDEKGLSIRPLVSFVEKDEEKMAFFLSPLGVYRENNETKSLKLVPLIRKRIEKENSEERPLSQIEVFPFFWGRTEKNETYWGIFPIYGKLKERFGREEISFFLWPFYTRVTYEEHVATNILWPFIRFAKARRPEYEEKYGGFKIWPLFGHFREGEEERSFFLWPFYIRQSYRDEYSNFEDKLYIFPFYLREYTNNYERKIYIWPFIQTVTAREPHYKQLDAPWPFFRKISGEDIEGMRLFPLYGYVRKKDSFESFVLWPLYFYSEFKDNSKITITEKKHRFLLLSKYLTINKNNVSILEELRLWPLLYSYNNSETNFSARHFPALIPVIDEGIERNYSPILRLYETVRQNDYEITRLLWGLYRQEKRGNRQVYELAFIMRRVCDERTNYIEFFEGLIGFGKIDGRQVLKIFFIDWKNRGN